MKNNLLLILLAGAFLIAFTKKNKTDENTRYEYLIVSDENSVYAEIFLSSQKKVDQIRKGHKEHIKTLITKILTNKSAEGWDLCGMTTQYRNNGNEYVTTYMMRKLITN